MSRMITMMAALAAAGFAAGCLQKETRHVLYLDPDGAVTWTTTEWDVHSDEQNPMARRTEEQEYLLAAQAGAHPMAYGLTALGPDSPVKTLVVRDERPFAVVTTAQFQSIGRLLETLFLDIGLHAWVRLEADGPRVTLTMRIDPASYAPKEGPADALTVTDDVVLVLTRGRFVAADGFDLSSDRTATLSAAWRDRAEAAWKAKDTMALSLTWEGSW